jgi:CheY-like chemotaxis protein
MTQEKEKIKILIVDDSERDLKLLESRVLQLGYQDVLKAREGTEALELARKHLPDLIFLDIIMPGLDGGAVKEVLKNDPKTKDIPTIFLSSIISKKEQKGIRGITGGGDTIIAKPPSLEELSAAINKALNR